MKLLDANQSYTFSKIFDLKIEPKNLAQYFDYSFTRTKLNLEQYKGELERLAQLKQRLEEVLPYASLSNETARREILISPIVIDLVYYTKAEISIEYQIKVNEQLQGYFDYLLESNISFLVIEAKKEDLDYGMSQLFAELIALDLIVEQDKQSYLVGAVTTGKICEFAQLDRKNKHLKQGLESFRVPEDLDTLMRILVQSLTT
ncbi:MAG: hypothetical protein AB4058_20455 [Microcystaceae cyanobacterium]